MNWSGIIITGIICFTIIILAKTGKTGGKNGKDN